MEIKKQELSADIYKEARQRGVTFTQMLEERDPSAAYSDDQSLRSTDAYQRQLMAHNIKISGADANLVQDFFRTSDSAALFPEFWNRNLGLGMTRGKLEVKLEDVVSTTTAIDSAAYRGVEVDEPKSDVSYKRTAEAAKFPVVGLKVKDKTINLQKIGLSVESTYEAIRRTKLNVMGRIIQMIGFRLQQDIVAEALNIILNGDGNGNPAPTIAAATNGTLTWEDIVKLELSFDRHESDMLIGNKTTVQKLLTLAEMKNPLVAGGFMTQGSVPTILGNRIKVSGKLPDGKLLAISTAGGVEMLEEEGASIVDTDRIINRQINETVISKTCGFSKMFADSAIVLTF